MKKVMGKLLSAMLILTLVFTSASVAFADSGETGAGEMKAEVSSVTAEDTAQDTVQEPQLEMKSEKAATVKADGVFPLTTVKTGNEQLRGYTVYPVEQYFILKAPSKGVFLFRVRGNSSNSGASVKIKTSPSASSYLDVAYISGTSERTLVAEVSRGGTYYLTIEPSYNSTGTLLVGGAHINGNDRTLTNKAWSAVGVEKAQTRYFKVRATSAGYITVQANNLSGNVTLMNSSKKKALSNAVSARDYSPTKVTFGVKKGTYYIKAKNNDTNDGIYQIKYTNKRIKEKSGKKKSRAVLLKKKRTKKGTIVAGEKRTDWYKFRVTKKKRVRITVKGATNNNLKVVIYKGKKRVGSGTYRNYHKRLTLRSYGKLSKGTYYIKVYRGSRTSSGWYSLSWR